MGKNEKDIQKTGKKAAGIILAFSFFYAAAIFAGCGAEKGKDQKTGMDAAGASVRNETSRATEEMNRENKEAKEPELWERQAKGTEQNMRGEHVGEAGTDGQKKEETAAEKTEKQDGEGQDGEGQDGDGKDSEAENNEEILLGEREGTPLQIVFLGDTSLGGEKEGTGIDDLTKRYCNAQTFNLTMEGTTAALQSTEKAEYENWTSVGLQGVVHAICGDIDAGLLEKYPAGKVLADCDFANTDYFVIAYGINDFRKGIPLNNEKDPQDEYSYVGALRIAVNRLKSCFPDAAIVLCSPIYAQFFGEDGAFLGDGNMAKFGNATLAEYYRVCGNVSADLRTLFLNAYEGIGLDAYTADEYLEDHSRLSEKGRQKYAEKLSRIILEYEMTKNN